MARLYNGNGVGCGRRKILRLYNDGRFGFNGRRINGLRLPRDDGTGDGGGDHTRGDGRGFHGSDGHPDTRLRRGGPIDGG